MKAIFLHKIITMALLSSLFMSFTESGFAAGSLADRLGAAALKKFAPDLLRVENRIDIPVNWRQTRARLGRTGASTQSESFREIWHLSRDGSGGGWLESGRAKVRVIKKTGTVAMPFFLEIEERALGQLLGIIKAQIDTQESENQNAATYKLNLSSNSEILKLIIKFPEGEHYAVQLQVGHVDIKSI